MRLDVVTPKGPLVQVDGVDEVTAPGVLGEFGVLPGHVPFLTGIRPGVLTWRHAGQSGSAAVSSGFAEIANDRIIVLTDAGLLPEKIDVAAAQADLDEAQRGIDAHAEEAGKRARLEEQRNWAQARLDAASAQKALPRAAH